MTTDTSIAGTLRTLMTNLIDYAGLFPPAGLTMRQAVANYEEYLNERSSWMLGKFVLPVSRLDEFETSAKEFFGTKIIQRPWQLTALGGEDPDADFDKVRKFNKDNHPRVRIDTFEIKATQPGEIDNVMALLPQAMNAYFEIPITSDPSPLISSIEEYGARAKVRTGGVTRDSFPTSQNLVRFLSACMKADVAFKATAGLHHPIRASYKLTYDEKSDTGMMYGFLNVFLAAAFLKKGMAVETARELLEERSSGAFQFHDEHVEWRKQKVTANDLAQIRSHSAIAFGSCSFHEPIEGLHTLHYL